MSKTLDRERQFNSKRREPIFPQITAPADLQQEPQAPECAAAVAVEETPQAAVPAAQEPVLPVRKSPQRGRRLLVLLLITAALAYRFHAFDGFDPFPALERGPSAREALSFKQTARNPLSARFIPPMIRFSAATALNEPAAAPAMEPASLPPTLRPLSVAAPLSLVSTQTFVQLDEANLIETPQAPEPVPAAALKPKTDPVLRTLQLMDTAVASAARVAAGSSNETPPESKKSGD